MYGPDGVVPRVGYTRNPARGSDCSRNKDDVSTRQAMKIFLEPRQEGLFLSSSELLLRKRNHWSEESQIVASKSYSRGNGMSAGSQSMRKTACARAHGACANGRAAGHSSTLLPSWTRSCTSLLEHDFIKGIANSMSSMEASRWRARMPSGGFS